MTSLSTLLLGVTGSGLVLVRILSQVEWWQRKEYRLDRLLSQLFSAENRSVFSPTLLLVLLALDAGWIAFFLNSTRYAQLGGWASLLLWLWYDTCRIYTRGLFRPAPTAKALLLTLVTIIATLALAWQFVRGRTDSVLPVATLPLLLPVIVAAGVGMVNLPATLRKKSIVAKAQALRAGHKKLTVVGITGSYGKTSTKHFLQQLLSDQSGVRATAEHRNAVFPVALDMLRQLTPDTSTYLVEMGAYRRGEIKELCELTQPHVGIITAISNQHLALFGSRENLAAAKWELIEALPADGIAVLNADIPAIVKAARGLKQKIVWFSSEAQTSQDREVSIFISNVTIKPQHIRGTLHLADAAQDVTIPLVSEAMLGSALGAAAAAWALTVPAQTIFRLIEQLKPFPQTLEWHHSATGAQLIDDSYSANERGVLAAIEHLGRFKDRHKVVVLTPLIELGQEGGNVHRRIGEALARSGAVVYVTNATYSTPLREGGQKVAPSFTPVTLPRVETLLRALNKHVKPDSVILLEGRLPEAVRQSLLKKFI